MQWFKHFKKSLIIISLILFSAISIFSITSCSSNHLQTINDNSNIPISNDTNQQTSKLTYTNYFNKQLSKAKIKQIKQDLKQRLTNIVNDYRLLEWNNYFNKQNNQHIIVEVLNLKYINYHTKINVKITTNNVFKKDQLKWTNIYLNQDNSFRYFNDFLHIINCEETKHHEDLLYLRWLYYSLDASYNYNHIKANNNILIKNFNLSNWISDISEVVSSSFINWKPIIKDIKAFLEYYGLSLNNNKLDTNIISNNIMHTLLCSYDLNMRLSTKDNNEIKRYPLWKLKAIRAKEIFNLTYKKYQLLADSFLNNNNSSFDDTKLDKDQIQQANQILDFIKQTLMQIINETLGNFIEIKLSNYTNLTNKV